MEDEALTEIKLWVAPEQVPYIRTKPIHASQKGPTLTAEGWILTIHVIPNYELTKLLLSFGDSIKIISPASYQSKMINILKNALQKYENGDI